MQITQYKFIKELPDTIKSQLVSFGYIEETKPEENWDEINERQDREFRGEKPTKYQETKYQEAKRKGDIAREKAERLVDHDKAMEIPSDKKFSWSLFQVLEVQDWNWEKIEEDVRDVEFEKEQETRFLVGTIGKQLELLTNSLNLVIKKINNL